MLDGDRFKYLAMLQNSAYTAAWLPHGRRLWRHLPGNIYRFFQSFGGKWFDVPDVLRALWNGLVKAGPAGAHGADFLQRAAAEIKLPPRTVPKLPAQAESKL